MIIKKHYLGTEDKLLRVSAIADSGHRSFDSPLHFIAYDFLFEYHSSLISGGTTQNSFVQSKNDINLMIRGQDNEISRGIFRKGYEIFIHSLKYNNEQAWGCELCLWWWAFLHSPLCLGRRAVSTYCNSGGSAKEFGIFSCLCPIYNCEFIDNEIVLYLFHLHILSIIVIS